jgi:hypothetical protein
VDVVLKSVVIVVKNVLTSGIKGCNMNERIKELAEQAGVLTDFGEDIKVGRWGIGGNYKQMQTFAELIIQKCAMIGNYAYDGGEYPGKMIKEYFGVE